MLAYGLSYRVIRDAAIERGTRDLEFSRMILEARIDDVYTTVAQLAASTDIAAVSRIDRPLPYPNYYDVIRFQKTLPLFNLTSTFIDNVYVYFYRAGIVASTSQVAIRTSMFYEHFFVHGDMTFTEWEQSVRIRLYRRSLLPTIGVGAPGRQLDYVRFYESFPLDSVRSWGVIMVYVREAEFMSYLSGIDVGDTGFLAVTDRSGDVIASSGSSTLLATYLDSGERLSRRNYVLLQTNSDAYPLRYVAAIPTTIFYGQVRLVGIVFLGIIAIEILVGVILGRHFAVRDMMPIRRLVESIAEPPAEGETRDEFAVIADSFRSMAHDNTELQETVERQAPVIQAAYIEQLLSGKFEDAEDAASARELAGLEFHEGCFAVCLASVKRAANSADDERRFSSQPIIQAVLVDRWRSIVGLTSFSSQIEPGTTAFLLNLECLEDVDYRVLLSERLAELERSFLQLGSVSVVVSCSESATSIAAVPELYVQAKSVHDYQLVMEHAGALFYSDIREKRTNRALFDLGDETTLTRAVIAGNQEKASLLLDRLLDSVLASRDLAPHSVELLLEQLEGALLRTIGALVFSDDQTQREVRAAIGASREEIAFHDRYDRLRGVFLDLCARAQRASSFRHDRLLDDMKQYIDDHHTDSQLGLNKLAEAFGLSPGYVSRFFKEHAGVGAAEFLEQLRIERATVLLRETDTAIGDIARSVGYGNPNTFYKAFRRIMGVSAGEYRQRNENHADGSANLPADPRFRL